MDIHADLCRLSRNKVDLQAISQVQLKYVECECFYLLKVLLSCLPSFIIQASLSGSTAWAWISQQITIPPSLEPVLGCEVYCPWMG